MKRFLFIATIAAGVAAAYLMQKRGESLADHPEEEPSPIHWARLRTS